MTFAGLIKIKYKMTHLHINYTIGNKYINSKKLRTKIIAIIQTVLQKTTYNLEQKPAHLKIARSSRKQIQISTKRNLQPMKWK